MKQIRWKLLMRYLFSDVRLRKSEVKLRLLSARLEVFGEDVGFGDVQETVDEAAAEFERGDVAAEEFVAFEDVDDFAAIFAHERLVVAAEDVQHLRRFLDDDVFEAGAGF